MQTISCLTIGRTKNSYSSLAENGFLFRMMASSRRCLALSATTFKDPRAPPIKSETLTYNKENNILRTDHLPYMYTTTYYYKHINF